jgi:hypothetical protein
MAGKIKSIKAETISESLIRKFTINNYSLEGLLNKVLAAEYRTGLFHANQIAAELTKARLALETHRKGVRENRP